MLWACARISSEWKLVAAFAATLLTLAVAGEVLLPGWIREFYAAMIAYRGYTRHLSPLDELVTAYAGNPAGGLGGCCRGRDVLARAESFRRRRTFLLDHGAGVGRESFGNPDDCTLQPASSPAWNFSPAAKLERKPDIQARIRLLGWVAAGCLLWPAVTATGLTVLFVLHSRSAAVLGGSAVDEHCDSDPGHSVPGIAHSARCRRAAAKPH